MDKDPCNFPEQIGASKLAVRQSFLSLTSIMTAEIFFSLEKANFQYSELNILDPKTKMVVSPVW